MDLIGSQVRRAGLTLRDIGLRQTEALCDALGMSPEQASRARDLFDLMTESWSAHIVGDAPPWPNDICDDGTPFEFSVAFEGKQPKFRLLVESQQMPITVQSSWEAGASLSERLRSRGDAHLEQLDLVRSLFQPTRFTPSRFSMWHAAVLDDGGRTLFKVYLNPHVLGTGASSRLVERALERLQLGGAWDFLRGRVENQHLPNDIRYFALDLEPAETARVKVYVAQTSTAEEVDRLIQGAANVEPGDARRWLSTLTNVTGHFQARPILSCFAFRRGRAAPDVTLHVPIRSYVEDDSEALDRISALLSDLEAARLRRAVTAISRRPPEGTRGVLTYASLTRQGTRTRVTVYLAPQIYSGANANRASIRPPPVGAAARAASTSSVRLRVPSSPMMTLGDLGVHVARRADRAFDGQASARPASVTPDVLAPQDVVSFALCALTFPDAVRHARAASNDLEVRALLEAVASESLEVRDACMHRLQGLGLLPDAPRLFGDEHNAIRGACFRLMAAVLHATEDLERYALARSFAEVMGRLADRIEHRAAPDSPDAPDRSTRARFASRFDESDLSTTAIPPASMGLALDAVERAFALLGPLTAPGPAVAVASAV